MKFNNIPDKVLESMQEQVYVRDLDMNIQYLNPAAEQLAGCAMREAQGKKCYELFGDASQRCRMNCPVEKAVAQKLPILHHEGKLKDKTGAEREMRVSISPVYENGGAAGAVVVMQDLSLLREQERLQVKTMMALEDKVEELEQTKNRLERTQQELKTVLDASPALIWQKDSQGRYLQVNRKYCETVGLSRETVIGKTDFELFPEAIAEKYAEDDRRSLVKGESQHGIIEQHVKPSGDLGWSRTDKIVWTDGAEGISGTIGFALDITEQKQAEDALQESTRAVAEALDFNSSILEHASIGILTYDAGGQCTFANQAAASIAGTEVDDLLHQNFHTLDSWKRSGLYEAAIEALHSERVHEIDTEMISTFGKRLCLNMRFSTFYSQGVTGLLVFMMDITQRKTAERENRINRLRLDIAHQIAGMAGTTEQDVYDYVLERMLELSDSPIGFLGFLTPDEQIMQIHAWSDQAMAQCGVQEHPLTFPIAEAGIWGEPVRTRKPCIINAYTDDHPAKKGCPEGHVHISRFMEVPVFDGERIVALAAVGNKEAPYEAIDARQMMLLMENCWDQIRRRRYEQEKQTLEKQLQQAQKMEAIGTLAGGIAHDFNNILYPLMGFTELLKEDVPQDSPLHSHIDEILQASMRARDLVKQILAFSRQGEQEYKPVRLQPVVKEALKLLRASLPAEIDIQQDIQSDCGLVVADPTQIHQILMNLATNAYQAMEASGGCLFVSLEQVQLDPDSELQSNLPPGAYVQLRMKDTGKGIEKHALDKIFEPYFTTKEVGRGTGLGLSVVQGIVKKSNGEIQISSEKGKGTEVLVYLPVLEDRTEERQSSSEQPIQGGTESLLLVDDELAIVKMEQQILERLGYRVTVRTGSVEALEAFRAYPQGFDLVVTDMSMPNMSGLQLSTELKRIRPDIPVILCTGFSDQINAEKSRALGIDGFVLKPVVRQEIAAVLRKVLEEREEGN